MAKLGFLALAFALAQTVAGHFQLEYPPSRGFAEEQEPTAPCGGFNTVGSRVAFPLKDGFAEIYSGHASWSYQIKLINSSSPSTTDFTSASVITQGNRNAPEAACLPLDLSSVSGLAAGQNATIQIIYNGGDGELYQCADVTLENNPTGFNASACVNADGSSNGQTGNGGNGGNSGAGSLTATGSLVLAAAAGVAALLAV